MDNVLTICFVIFAILLFSILLNQGDKNELHADIRDLRNHLDSRLDSLRREMDARSDKVHAELHNLHGRIGELKGQLDAIGKRLP